MKKLSFLLAALLCAGALWGCASGAPGGPASSDAGGESPVSAPSSAPADPSSGSGPAEGEIPIVLTAGAERFEAILYDNEAARAFRALLPLTLEMADLNGNEKYFYLDEDLPATATEAPPTLHAGELMCWSGNCLVLFYESFESGYGGYVRLGRVADAEGLAGALGPGDVTVTFSAAE